MQKFNVKKLWTVAAREIGSTVISAGVGVLNVAAAYQNAADVINQVEPILLHDFFAVLGTATAATMGYITYLRGKAVVQKYNAG